MDAATSSERSSQLHTRCCIVGGGPAGMMLGYLLGRAGIDTLVLEKHAGFFWGFWGGRHRSAGAEETCRFFSGFSRRHRASLDASGDGRTRPDRRVPEAAASAT